MRMRYLCEGICYVSVVQGIEVEAVELGVVGLCLQLHEWIASWEVSEA